MGVMPLVAKEPWSHAENFARTENDLYKMFKEQAFRAEQADLQRSQQNNMQTQAFGNSNYQQGRNFDFQTQRQNDQFAHQRSMAEDFGGGGGPAPKLVEKMREKMNDLVAMGVPQHIAAALVGNAVQESGIDAARVGDGGASIGEYQFNERGEQPALRKFAAERGLNINDPKTQRQFVWNQLQGPYKAVYEKMLAAKDPAIAAEIFSREYERPDPKFANNDRRRKYATQAYTMFGVRNPNANAQTAQAPAGNAQSQTPSIEQQSATTPAPNNSGTGTMPDPNKPSGKKAKKVIGPDGTVKYVLE